MKQRSAPLRFLLLVVAGWIGIRTAMVAPGWWVETGAASPRQAAAASIAPRRPGSGPWQLPAQAPRVAASAPRIAVHNESAPVRRAAAATDAAAPFRMAMAAPAVGVAARSPAASSAPPAPLATPSSFRPPLAPNRWSASSWLLVRGDGTDGLAPRGSLGGSQAGVRLALRLNGDAARPLALAAHLYAPLRDRRGAEAAFGLDWRPSAALPVHLLVERRQAIGERGRSGFSIAAYGGVAGRRLPAGLRLDGWGQAGLVGLRARDPFVDGSLRITAPAGRVEVGGGLWGGAQPGAARLDAGPLVSARLPLAGATVRVSAEWRFRIAGYARPGSGPALTIGSDF